MTAPASHDHVHRSTVGIYVLLGMAIAFALWCCWIGTVLARLWYYGGEVNGEWEKFDIQPEYIRERIARQKENATHRHTMTTVINPAGANVPRFILNVRNMDEDEVTDSNLRRRILEERRISRLPAFVQDDGGDGSEFPDIPYGIPAAEHNARLAQLDPKPKVNHRDLGLHRARPREWLTVDGSYSQQRDVRDALLDRVPYECVQSKPLGEDASVELLDEVVHFITEKYPENFRLGRRGGVTTIENRRTGEEWLLEPPFKEVHPLQICARLVIEDFCILMKDAFTGQYSLAASATCFPSGWRLIQRIGQSVTKMIDPVLSWENFADILEYFDDSPDSPSMKRSSTFIQTDPDRRGDEKLLFIQRREDFFPGNISTIASADAIVLRTERHSFRRLPKSGAIVFTVRTKLRDLVTLTHDERMALMREIESWSEDMAVYKGKYMWQTDVYGFINGGPTARDDRTVLGPEDD